MSFHQSWAIPLLSNQSVLLEPAALIQSVHILFPCLFGNMSTSHKLDCLASMSI
jgi:hypothetical protein